MRVLLGMQGAAMDVALVVVLRKNSKRIIGKHVTDGMQTKTSSIY